MTHFAVAVITDGTKTVEELMLPYMENCCETPPKEYMQFFEEEECDIDPDTGKRGYWQNPNAKWDWYVVGGRWHGMIRAAKGELGEPSWCNENSEVPAGRFDVVRIKDIDHSVDQEAYDRRIAQWEYNVEGKEGDESLKLWESKDYLIRQYKNKETFAKVESMFSFRAVVTPDGEWREVRETGWWGYCDESPGEYIDWVLHFKERFIDPCDSEWVLHTLDCHI